MGYWLKSARRFSQCLAIGSDFPGCYIQVLAERVVFWIFLSPLSALFILVSDGYTYIVYGRHYLARIRFNALLLFSELG